LIYFIRLEIKNRIDNIIEEMSFYLIPASLGQLHRSGRLSGSQLLLGQLLRIHLLKVRLEKNCRRRQNPYLQEDEAKAAGDHP